MHVNFWLFVCESMFVCVHVNCVCVCLNLCQGCSIQTHRFGLMDFIDFRSLYNELQGSQCVERKKEGETSVRNNKK